jgi:hypothetical protein
VLQRDDLHGPGTVCFVTTTRLTLPHPPHSCGARRGHIQRTVRHCNGMITSVFDRQNWSSKRPCMCPAVHAPVLCVAVLTVTTV